MTTNQKTILACLHMLLANAKSKSHAEQLIEKLYDENGNLLFEKPYQFKNLFKAGQLMTIKSIHMTVLSCELNDGIVTTKVKLSKPWIP